MMKTKNMKTNNVGVLALLLLLIVCGPLYGQEKIQNQQQPVKESEPVKNIIKISPFHFVDGTFLMSYERMLGSQKSSLMFSAGIHSRSNRDYYNGNNVTPEFGFQEELQYRLYVVQPQNVSRNGRGFWYFKGFYAGPYISHRYLQRSVYVWDWVLQQNTTEPEKLNEVGGGVVLGVQVALGNKFFIDFFTGGGIKRSMGLISQNYYAGVTDPGYNGVYPKIGLQLGIGL
jgi:hypothetical protein